jgi:hypothetical protein
VFRQHPQRQLVAFPRGLTAGLRLARVRAAGHIAELVVVELGKVVSLAGYRGLVRKIGGAKRSGGKVDHDSNHRRRLTVQVPVTN